MTWLHRMRHSLTTSRLSWFASLSLCLDLSRSTQDQFLRAVPVSGGMGELLMRKMGWRSGEGLGKHREGTVEPIIMDFKTDRKGEKRPAGIIKSYYHHWDHSADVSVHTGLVAEGEKTQKSGNIVVMKDLLGECLITRRVFLDEQCY